MKRMLLLESANFKCAVSGESVLFRDELPKEMTRVQIAELRAMANAAAKEMGDTDAPSLIEQFRNAQMQQALNQRGTMQQQGLLGALWPFGGQRP